MEKVSLVDGETGKTETSFVINRGFHHGGLRDRRSGMITAEIGGCLRIRTTLPGNAVLPANRKTFKNNMVAFVQERGLDGVDFDWEYPGSV
ncbi:hypothetical protein NEUTE2DRAFT_162151 [Neurospora tetrasperma FGSC 2509]|nr:hypothetical protein NEUTE2DRAFT_162151 [Neurospora tetrasperma FGSC 2509]